MVLEIRALPTFVGCYVALFPSQSCRLAAAARAYRRDRRPDRVAADLAAASATRTRDGADDHRVRVCAGLPATPGPGRCAADRRDRTSGACAGAGAKPARPLARLWRGG